MAELTNDGGWSFEFEVYLEKQGEPVEIVVLRYDDPDGSVKSPSTEEVIKEAKAEAEKTGKTIIRIRKRVIVSSELEFLQKALDG